MNEKRQYSADPKLEIVDRVVTGLSTHPRITPPNAKAVRTAVGNELDKSLRIKEKNYDLGGVRDIDYTINHLLRHKYPNLTPTEVKNYIEVLADQREIAINNEAEQRKLDLESSVKRSPTAQILSLVPICGALIACLYTANQAIDSYSNYLNTENELLKNPNYQTSKIFESEARHLDNAISYLGNEFFFSVPSAKKELAQADAQEKLADLEDYPDIKKISASLSENWTISSIKNPEVVKQRGAIATLSGRANSNSKFFELKAPQDQLFQRDNLFNRYRGWTIATGISLLIGVLGSLPREFYFRARKYIFD